MFIKTSAPIDRRFELPDEFAVFPLQDSGKMSKNRRFLQIAAEVLVAFTELGQMLKNAKVQIFFETARLFRLEHSS